MTWELFISQIRDIRALGVASPKPVYPTPASVAPPDLAGPAEAPHFDGHVTWRSGSLRPASSFA